MYVISGSTHQRLGASLAEEMDAEFCGVVNRHFPDGERYIRILMDVDGQDYDYTKVFSRKHLVLPASSGLMYWSNTFQINRKVDSSYGSKIKGQKKEKANGKIKSTV